MEASGRVYQPEGVDLSFIVERDVCACLFVCLLVFCYCSRLSFRSIF